MRRLQESGDRSVGRLVAAVAARHVRDGATAVVLVGDASFVVDQCTVDKGAHHSPVEGLPFERTPITFREDLVWSERPWAVGLHKDEIGHVASTEETSIFDAESSCWIVRHEFDHAFNGQDSFVDQS